MVYNFVSGGAAVNALARNSDAEVRVLDLGVATTLDGVPDAVTRYKVCEGTGDITVENAMTVEQSEQAFRAGMSIADEEVDAGADVLIPGDMGIGNTTPAAALIGLLANQDALRSWARHRNRTRAWMRKCAAVRDAMRRGRGGPASWRAAGHDRRPGLLGDDRFPAPGSRASDPGHAGRRDLRGRRPGRPSHRVPRRKEWWLAGHRSAEPAHTCGLSRLQLEPLLDYGMRLGEGTGALLALPVLRAAAATLAEMATFDEAGVSDRPIPPGVSDALRLAVGTLTVVRVRPPSRITPRTAGRAMLLAPLVGRRWRAWSPPWS